MNLLVAGAAALVALTALPCLAVLALATRFGQRDPVGPLEPLHSSLDTQVSLLHATTELSRGKIEGTRGVDAEFTREVDAELGEAFE